MPNFLYPISITIPVLTYFTYVLKPNTYQNFSISVTSGIGIYVTIDNTSGQIIISKCYFTTTFNSGPAPCTVYYQDIMLNNYQDNFVLNVLESVPSPMGMNNIFFLKANNTYDFTPFYNVESASTQTYDLYSPDTTGGLYPPSTFSTTLPNLLFLDGATGSLSGSLSIFSLLQLTQYQMRVTDNLSYSYTYLSISVDLIPTFKYPNTPYIFNPGDAVNIVPIISSGAIGVIYTMDIASPGLPNGLTLNTYNGTISGVAANDALGQNTYTVTANSASGGSTFLASLVIIINLIPSFAYPQSPYNVVQGAVTTIVPNSYAPYTPGVLQNQYIYQHRISPPQKAHTNAIFRNDKEIIFFGDSDNNSNDVWNFDSTTSTWSNITNLLTDRPPTRYDAVMVYNSNTDQILLFGGFTNTSVFDPTGGGNGVPSIPPPTPPGTIVQYNYFYNDTWIYDCKDRIWSKIYPQNLSSTVQPVIRSKAAMVYDSNRNQAILFGGSNEGPMLNDTWLFDFFSNTWLNIIPTDDINSPPSREVPVFSYSILSDEILLFGGRYFDGVSLAFFNDTWVFDADTQTWQELVISAPPSVRGYTSTAYSIENDVTIIYGGFNGTNFWTDTYYFDHSSPVASWTLVDIGISIVPTVPSTTSVFQFIGTLPLININGSDLILFNYRDVFALNIVTVVQPYTGAWLSLTTYPDYLNYPPGVAPINFINVFAIAYNPNDNTVLYIPLFGSFPWLLNIADTTWTQVPPNPLSPTIYTFGANLVYCSISNVYLFFGGQNVAVGAFSDETWIYTLNNNTWRKIETPGTLSPSGRFFSGMAYNPNDDRVYLFGGQTLVTSNTTNLNDTWYFDMALELWFLVTPVFNRSPTARLGGNFVLNTTQNTFILFGGQLGIDPASSLFGNDVWEFDPTLNLWTELFANGATGSPPPRALSSMVYDSYNDSFIMYGGYSQFQPFNQYYNDTWQLTLAKNGAINKFVNLNPGNAPKGYQGAEENDVTVFAFMIYDDNNDNIFLSNLNTYYILYPAIQPVPPLVPFGVTFAVTGNCPLPLGLTLNATTGIISGTPTILSPPRLYSITGTNTNGATTVTFIMNVIRPYLGSRATSLCFSKDQTRVKGDILQYNVNKFGQSLSMQWSQAVRNVGPGRKRSWAGQGDKNTNPNLNLLPLAQNRLLCPSNPIVCAPTSASNVPGPEQILCYNTSLPTLLTRNIRTFTLNGTKWPQSS
jgi:N-acetylneuraminic acid mutarotase